MRVSWRGIIGQTGGIPIFYFFKVPVSIHNKVPGPQLGFDEPDLPIASVAMTHNFILVTNDQNAGMARVKQAAGTVAGQGTFPTPLPTENWLR